MAVGVGCEVVAVSGPYHKALWLLLHEPPLHWHNWRMRRNDAAAKRHARRINTLCELLAATFPEAGRR